MELTAEEGRVLGVLLEKQRTTPADYPLSANAVMRACNQSTSREPVVTYDEATVDRALVSLRERRLTRIVYSPSNRAPKHRHVLDEVLGLDDGALAVLALLLLRGPQTPAELRARADRLHQFADSEQVGRVLSQMAERDDPLVAVLDRLAGRREARWTEVTTIAAPEPSSPLLAVARPTAEERDPAPAPPANDAEHRDERIDHLQEQVDELRRRLDELVAELSGAST